MRTEPISARLRFRKAAVLKSSSIRQTTSTSASGTSPLLSDVIEAQQPQGDAHALKHIRAIGFNEEYYTADALDMLARLSDGSYSGLSAE